VRSSLCKLLILEIGGSILKNTEKITKLEGQEVAGFIHRLPPKDELALLKSFDDNRLTEVICFWKWLGISLDAYFSDIPDPMLTAGLPQDFITQIQLAVQKYLSLSVVIFQSEHLIRSEAKRCNLPVDNYSRSGLLKIWACEESLCHLHTLQMNYHESLSSAKWSERSREIQKYVEGEVIDLNSTTLKRWNKEDKKLIQEKLDHLTPFTDICMRVFMTNKDKIPALRDFMRNWQPDRKLNKFTISKGFFKPYPSRGKGKKASSKLEAS
jgi:hypothetical protein